jgi:hypothetical protein
MLKTARQTLLREAKRYTENSVIATATPAKANAKAIDAVVGRLGR